MCHRGAWSRSADIRTRQLNFGFLANYFYLATGCMAGTVCNQFHCSLFSGEDDDVYYEQGDILSEAWIHFENARSKAHPVIQGYLSCRSDWDQYSAAITVEPMFTAFLTKQQPPTSEELKQFPGHIRRSPVKWAGKQNMEGRKQRSAS